jgi:hypothetical protein
MDCPPLAPETEEVVMSKARNAQTFIMGAALVATGVFEFLDGVERKEKPLKAAARAYERTKVRGKAIKRAARAAARELREKEAKEAAEEIE